MSEKIATREAYGKALEVLREYGLTADQIAARIKETL